MGLHLRALVALTVFLAAIQLHEAQNMRGAASQQVRAPAPGQPQPREGGPAPANDDDNDDDDAPDDEEDSDDDRNMPHQEQGDEDDQAQQRPQSVDLKQIKQKATDFKQGLTGLSGSALKMQCQQLDQAVERGQQKWMQDQGFFDGLSKMCEAIKEKNGKKFHEGARQEKDKLKEVAYKMQKHFSTHSGGGGNAVAMGCTALLAAKHNGKMEWFETQGWYKNALKMCTGLSGKGPEELEPEEKLTGRAEYERDMSKKKPLELLEETCKQLSKIESESTVGKKKWFPEAQQMCVTVKSASPDELKSLVDRQATRAETASGQLIKKTCENIHKDFKTGGMKDSEGTTWMPTVMAMCQKMGTRKVDGKQLKQRCETIKKLKEEGKDKTMREKAWYGHLMKTCDWLWKKQKAFHQGPDKQPIVTV